ncbi:MAG: hypothetical protein GX605_10440, partial [Chloroflexi bacterium]|nr:hypothetical protein [Chloroflexota bacterium]
MTTRILLVDPDAAFAAMFLLSVGDVGGYSASAATSLAEAQAALRAQPCDLAVVDAPALGQPLAQVAARLRAVRPALRLMAVSDDGPNVPGSPEVQGVLPKPFFVGELPALLEAALQQPWEPVMVPPSASSPELTAVLSRLCREVG